MPVYTPGFTEAQIDEMAFDPSDLSVFGRQIKCQST